MEKSGKFKTSKWFRIYQWTCSISEMKSQNKIIFKKQKTYIYIHVY